MSRYALVLVLFLQADPYAELKAGTGDAKALLAKALETESAAGLQSLDAARLLRAGELARPYSEAYARQIAHLVLSLGAKPKGCDACSGGMADCPSCENGIVAQSCRTCSGKGTTSCLMCATGEGMTHASYHGRMRFVLERDVTIKDVTLVAQTLVWDLKPCSGGSVSLKAISTPRSPKHPDKTEKATLSCGEIYDQFEQFMYRGKAKVWLGDDPSKSKPLTLDGAKRIFGEFKKCKGGIIPCTQCGGSKTQPCIGCHAKGTRPAPCQACGGAKAKLCEKCLLVGDGAWVAARVAPSSVPELGKILERHGAELAAWDRARGSRGEAGARLAALKKDLDPKAKLADNTLTLPCPACQGAGGTCAECWGTGRREYAEGTAEYDRYATVRVIEAQLAAAPKPPPLKVDFAKPPPPVVDVPPVQRPADSSGVGSGVGGTVAGLPADVKEMLEKAQKHHDAAKESLAKSKATTDPDVWSSEAKKAIEGFRAAQRLLTQVQETLDDRGVDIPAEVLERVRNNLQALVMARKQSP